MKVYSYDKDTKEFLSETAADQDPLSSAIHALISLEKTDEEISKALGVSKEAAQEVRADGEPSPLVPSDATPVQPPRPVEKKARVFNGTAWEYVDDYRGTEVKANDGSGRTKVIEELGVKPEDVRFDKLDDAEVVKQVKTDMKELLNLMLDYMLKPTPEKAQVLLAKKEELDAA